MRQHPRLRATHARLSPGRTGTARRLPYLYG